jgi:hypothetical protein
VSAGVKREKPILFSAPMVRALLAGTKTQTRRIMKPQPPLGWFRDEAELADDETWKLLTLKMCPYGVAGHRLWVKESHALIWPGDGPPDDVRDNRVEYRADTDGIARPAEWPMDCNGPERPRWRPSIHMHRWASRITLEITAVRVERLQAITEADAYAEGVEHGSLSNVVENYAMLWEKINGADSWDANPWVWVIEFRRVSATEAP